MRLFRILAALCLFAVCASAQTTVVPYLNSTIQLLDNNGVICSGCLLDTFAAGSTTPLATYSESTGTTPNANPIVLSSAGRATVYLTTATYKFRLRAADGTTIWTQDGISAVTPISTFASIIDTGDLTLQKSTAATSGANQSGNSLRVQGNYWTGSASAIDQWIFSDVLGTGANPTSTLTISHSGSSGNATVSWPSMTFNNLTISGLMSAGSSAISGNETVGGNQTITGNVSVTGNEAVTGTLAVTGNSTLGSVNNVAYYSSGSLQTLLNSTCTSGLGGTVVLPKGVSTSGAITLTSAHTNCALVGQGKYNSIIKTNAGTNADGININGANTLHFEGFTLDHNGQNQTAGSGIHTLNTVGDTFSDLRILNGYNHGLWTDDGTGTIGGMPGLTCNDCDFVTQLHGSGWEGGNSFPNACISGITFNGGSAQDSRTADGYFPIGSKSAGQYCTDQIHINNPTCINSADTCIEISTSSQNVTVTNPIVRFGSNCVSCTGISVRSAQNVTITDADVAGTGAANQLCLLLWNNAGNDNTTLKNVKVSGIFKGCNANPITTATYTSGGSITGSNGQTCAVAFGSGGGTGTVALTGANVIAGGTSITITAGGLYTAAPTSATLSNGTATCSGTATVASVLNITAHDVQVNLATAGTAGVGDNVTLGPLVTDGGAANYNYLGKPTNFRTISTDDGVQQDTANDITLQPGSAKFVRALRPTSVGASAFSMGSEQLHVQSGGALQDLIVESTADANEGISIRNSAQNWVMGVRTDLSEDFNIRDITGGVDALRLAKTTGNGILLGKFTSYNAVSTADFGVPILPGTPQHPTGQTANIAATNLVTSAPAGTYEVHADCRTTTSGSGTTATFSVLWTDEGGAKTTTSATWALNSVTATGQVNSITVLHAAAASNIQYSVTGTFGTSVYACDAWATRTQ